MSIVTGRHRPLGPIDRYELWIKSPQGAERKFTVNTRVMPARCGHEVSLIITAHPVPQVLGLANWSTIDGVNYARTEAPSLVRAWDIAAMALAFLVMAVIWSNIGMVLFLPAAAAYLLMVSGTRAVARTRRIWQVDQAIDVEAWRGSQSARRLQ